MLDFETEASCRIQQMERGPHPHPLEHGFTEGTAYRVVAIYNPSESGGCWLVMLNDRDELWYISQRHVRTYALLKDENRFRVRIYNSQPLRYLREAQLNG